MPTTDVVSVIAVVGLVVSGLALALATHVILKALWRAQDRAAAAVEECAVLRGERDDARAAADRWGTRCRRAEDFLATLRADPVDRYATQAMAMTAPGGQDDTLILARHSEAT